MHLLEPYVTSSSLKSRPQSLATYHISMSYPAQGKHDGIRAQQGKFILSILSPRAGLKFKKNFSSQLQ